VANFHGCRHVDNNEQHLAAFIKLVESNFAAGYGTGGSEQLQVQKRIFFAHAILYTKNRIFAKTGSGQTQANLEPKRRHDV
jgi:hypothetical protein